MFDKDVKHAIAYIKDNGLNHLVYKIYKKAMYKYYKNKLKIPHKSPAIHLDRNFEYPMITPFIKTVVPININSKVSIVLLFRGGEEELERCVDSISNKSTYENYEVIIMAYTEINETLLEKLNPSRIKVVIYDKSLGYSMVVNRTVTMLESEYIVLLSDSLEIVSPNWIEELQYCFTSSEVGVAGTPSCLMIDIKLFVLCNGLNEYFFTSYSVLDLCLRVREMGKTVLSTPRAIIQNFGSDNEDRLDLMDKALLLNCWDEICL